MASTQLRPDNTEELDRRAGVRHATVLKVGIIEVDGRERLCMVRNISFAGLQATTFVPIPDGTQVRVSLREQCWHDGVVVWQTNTAVGIAFKKLLHSDALEAELGNLAHQPQRVPRLRLEVAAVLRVGSRNHPATLINISPNGAGMRLQSVSGRTDLCLHLPGLAPMRGQIRWTNETSLGMSFNESLPLPALARWIDGLSRG